MRTRPLAAAALGALAALLPHRAAADAAGEARLREALRAATLQLRALQDEQAGWKTREAELGKELEALRAKGQAAARPRGSDREAADLRRRLAEQAEAAARASSGLAQCQADRTEADRAARAAEEERGRLAAETSTLGERLRAAQAKNERLYRVGKDVIDWLGRVGVGAALAAREPFLGLKRVELENAAQEHEDRLLEQRLLPPGG